MTTNFEKSAQIERDFKIPNPLSRMSAALHRASDAEVTPFTVRVGRERLAALESRGFREGDNAIILLMRGARREAVAAAMGYRMKHMTTFVADIRGRLRALTEADLDEMAGVALENIDLMRRA